MCGGGEWGSCVSGWVVGGWGEGVCVCRVYVCRVCVCVCGGGGGGLTLCQWVSGWVLRVSMCVGGVGGVLGEGGGGGCVSMCVCEVRDGGRGWGDQRLMLALQHCNNTDDTMPSFV